MLLPIQPYQVVAFGKVQFLYITWHLSLIHDWQVLFSSLGFSSLVQFKTELHSLGTCLFSLFILYIDSWLNVYNFTNFLSYVLLAANSNYNPLKILFRVGSGLKRVAWINIAWLKLDNVTVKISNFQNWRKNICSDISP